MEQADYENKYVILTQEILGSKDLTPVEKMVLARITGFKIFFESNEATAEFLDVNPDTVKKAKQKLEKLGYIYTPSNPDADLGIQVTYIIKTEKYVQYYDDPYWWLDYPGYWPSGYWGNWTGYYYPRPVVYTYTTNALVADMVDLTADEDPSKPLEVVWSAYIGGPAGATVQGDVKRMTAAVDQAFAQSQYLAGNKSR